MRLYVTFLLLMVAVNGEFDNKRNLLRKDASTENNALTKRAPALSTVSSPANAGVEYADTKQQLADKSPSQREYATPAPQFSKFSDLLAGQAPSYQAAIASQLFSPVSVYQPRVCIKSS
ncbi:uncharacterized protein LOC106710137 [Papilio machaon]|uniref:uncharacterized protein LOC106710137 n=1 Tax=Papilio machaon TaxID=76193 RepID=UPI001E664DAA|nr:uncharacterized protein LOC106710137 [Papilio machaon]